MASHFQIHHHNRFLDDVRLSLKDDELYKQWHSYAEDDFDMLPEEVEEADCVVGHGDRFVKLNNLKPFHMFMID